MSLKSDTYPYEMRVLSVWRNSEHVFCFWTITYSIERTNYEDCLLQNQGLHVNNHWWSCDVSCWRLLRISYQSRIF